MKQKKTAPRGCALARSRNMSQATALGARMCQGTSFHAVKFIIHPVLCKISNSENTVCKSELFVIYFPIFFSVVLLSNSLILLYNNLIGAMIASGHGWEVVAMKNILFIASEAVPFIKTGGLADVVGSLPKCFDKQYFDVRVMIPKYLCIKESFRNEMKYVNHFYMDYLGQNRYVGILEYEYEGVTFYFIDNESYFWGDRPYGDWYYDLEKFSFFCKAALSSLPVIGFKPDVIHCHDWQTGLIPVHLKDKFHGGEFFRDIKSVMTIHNLKFQGVWDVKTIQHFSELPDYYFTPDKLEAYKDGNMLKGGIVYADAITTVSNTYAEEIKTPFYGEGLDGLMRARSNSLRGILNGIDYDEFNPETDKRIVQNYNAKTFRKEKSKNKKALQAELGLAQDEKKVHDRYCLPSDRPEGT